jgi:hydroxymethylglutaryl-CoA synthase
MLRVGGRLHDVHGILGIGAYVPYWRLDLSGVADVAGGGGRKGTRAVASFDQDATTLAVEAARIARRRVSDLPLDSVWFATAAPPYLDRTNATGVHAALRLPEECGAYDVIGSLRGAMGALRAAAAQPSPALAVAADLRTGLAGGPDESYFGDGAAAIVVGDDSSAPVLAELDSWVSLTGEFVDRWRVPGELRSRVWEERFGELRYAELGAEALARLWKAAGVGPEAVDHLIVTGTHGRACRTVAQRSGVASEKLVDDLGSVVGNTGVAHPFLLLAQVLESAEPGQTIALVVLADGAEAIVLRTTPAIETGRPTSATLKEQMANSAPVSYGRYLAWRGILPVEPPRRPEPARTSSSAAGRSVPWKFGFEGSRDEDGTVHLPPLSDASEYVAMAEARGTVTTFTIDRLSYTPSPPMVFAVVDFDGGGRLPVELTDVDAGSVRVGDRVEMTFRRLSGADGIHNYFWKARPLSGSEV